MKKIIYFLFITLIFSNCNEKSNDSDFLVKNSDSKGKNILPDISNIVTQNHFNKNKIHVVVDSIAKDWKGLLEFAIQDKTLIKINEQGLSLLSYELIDDSNLLNSFLKSPLSEESYLPVYDIENYNNFKIVQPYKTLQNANTIAEKKKYN